MRPILEILGTFYSSAADAIFSNDHPNDNDATRNAAQALASYNSYQAAQRKGSCEESVVRLCDEGASKYALGWVHPGYHDSVSVRLFTDGHADWCYADDPDEVSEYRTDFGRNHIATGVLAVLQQHRVALLGPVSQGNAPRPSQN